MSVLDLLARTLTAEAGGEGVPGLLAAGSVIANRVRAGTYGDGFEGVIMRPGQFSAWNGVTGYAGGQGALNMDRIRPTPEAMAVSEAILQGRLADPTGGATHYYNPNAANPAWGANRAGGDWLTIGNHIFGNPDGRPGSSEPRPTQPQPQATMSTMNTTEAEPMPGLLGRIGQQVTERMPFLQDKDRMARLAMGIEGMTLNPNQALMGSLQQGIEGRQDEDRMNRTAEWLAAQPGGGQFAAAIAAGGNAGQVMQSYFESQQGMSPYEAAQTDYVRAQTDALQNPQPETTAAMQNYEYLVAQGMDPIQAMDQAFGSGGTVVNVNEGGAPSDAPLRTELMKQEGDLWGSYLSAGNTAAGMSQDLGALEQLVEIAPQGPVTGRLAQALPGYSSAGDAFQAIVQRVAPSLRVEGSGSTSDIEYAGFLRSMPSLANRPEANRAIIGMLEAKAQINQARGGVIAAYQNGEIDAAAARQRLSEIDSRSIMSPELQAVLQPPEDAAADPQAAPQSAQTNADPGRFSSMSATEINGVFQSLQGAERDQAIARLRQIAGQ